MGEKKACTESSWMISMSNCVRASALIHFVVVSSPFSDFSVVCLVCWQGESNFSHSISFSQLSSLVGGWSIAKWTLIRLLLIVFWSQHNSIIRTIASNLIPFLFVFIFQPHSSLTSFIAIVFVCSIRWSEFRWSLAYFPTMFVFQFWCAFNQYCFLITQSSKYQFVLSFLLCVCPIINTSI